MFGWVAVGLLTICICLYFTGGARQALYFYNGKLGIQATPLKAIWNGEMAEAGLAAHIEKDIIAAMKARDAERTTTLRMVKSALKNKEIEKRQPLTEPEVLQILTTLIKQRRESVEQFTKGNRPELAAKESAEIVLIEAYMPKSASEDEIRAHVLEAIAGIAAKGAAPGPRDMGTVMKDVQARIQAAGVRADGRQVSEIVKTELARS